jgi:hypothetical protein
LHQREDQGAATKIPKMASRPIPFPHCSNCEQSVLRLQSTSSSQEGLSPWRPVERVKEKKDLAAVKPQTDSQRYEFFGNRYLAKTELGKWELGFQRGVSFSWLDFL